MKVFILVVLTFSLTTAIQLISKAGCGQQKGCYFRPKGCDPSSNCTVALTYAVSNDVVNFELGAQVRIQLDSSQGQYIAVGFSSNKQMEDDAVTACIFTKEDPSKTAVALSYNVKDDTNNEPIKDNTNGITTLTESGIVGKSFVCRLKQKINPQFKDSRVRALNVPYHLLLVTGTANLKSNTLTVHSTSHSDKWFPSVSPNKVDVSSKRFDANI